MPFEVAKRATVGRKSLHIVTRKARSAAGEHASSTALAHDVQHLNAAAPPRFPASLVMQERRYLEAVESGEALEISVSRVELDATLEALLESDRQRLWALNENSSSVGPCWGGGGRRFGASETS
jgi:hypothetical protein